MSARSSDRISIDRNSSISPYDDRIPAPYARSSPPSCITPNSKVNQKRLLEHRERQESTSRTCVQLFPQSLVRLHSLRNGISCEVVKVPGEIDQLDARLL